MKPAMGNALTYLPGFDAGHLERYFHNDRKIVAELFAISNETMPEDLDTIQNGFEGKDIDMIREVLHKIKPAFNMVGLLSLEKEVGEFHEICVKATSFEQILEKYAELWPKLLQARDLIGEQSKLLSGANQLTTFQSR
jgi:hypothetical protein